MLDMVTNQMLREIFEEELLKNSVPNVFQLANPHNFSVNPKTDNYIDMYNEIAFNIFKLGFEVAQKVKPVEGGNHA